MSPTPTSPAQGEQTKETAAELHEAAEEETEEVMQESSTECPETLTEVSVSFNSFPYFSVN